MEPITIARVAPLGNSCLKFDGTDDYVKIETLAWKPEAFTVDWWLFPLANKDYNQQIRAVPATEGGPGFFFHVDAHGGAKAGTGGNSSIKALGCVAPNQWHHLAFSFDGVGRGRLYRHGIRLVESRTNEPMPKSGEWKGFEIGAPDTSTLNGYIAEIRIWNRELAAPEIRDLTFGQISGRERSDLQIYWRLDEGFGDILFDHSMGGRHSVFLGERMAKSRPEWSISSPRRPLLFGALNSVQPLAARPLLSPWALLFGSEKPDRKKRLGFVLVPDFALEPGTFSVEWWFLPQAPCDSWPVSATVDSWQDDQWGAFVAQTSKDGKLIVGTSRADQVIKADYKVGVWQHVAFTFASSGDGTGNAFLFLNGSKIGEKSVKLGYQNPWKGFRIGGTWFGSKGRFEGAIKEVRVWRTARSEEEILLNMHNRITGAGLEDLVAYWPFSEGAGDIVYDHSGHGFQGSRSWKPADGLKEEEEKPVWEWQGPETSAAGWEDGHETA